MERFERIVVGYHGCTEELAHGLLLGTMPISDWQPSKNRWDWLGHGIYFWEHAPSRALRWAREAYQSQGQVPSVIGAIIQLGRCFDLLDESVALSLGDYYGKLEAEFAKRDRAIPKNRGKDFKRRDLDCLVINQFLDELRELGQAFDTVRGAFLEGKPAYPGAGFSSESHIQIAVRNPTCILGVFRPNLTA